MITHAATILSFAGLLALSTADEVGDGNNARLRLKSNDVGVKGEEQEQDMFAADRVQAAEVFASEMEVWERLLQDMSASMSMPPAPEPAPTDSPVAFPTSAPASTEACCDADIEDQECDLLDDGTFPPAGTACPEGEVCCFSDESDNISCIPEEDCINGFTVCDGVRCFEPPSPSPTTEPGAEDFCCDAVDATNGCFQGVDGTFPANCDLGDVVGTCCFVPDPDDPDAGPGTGQVQCLPAAQCPGDVMGRTDCANVQCPEDPRDACCADVERLGMAPNCGVGSNNIISENCFTDSVCCLLTNPEPEDDEDLVECLMRNDDGSLPDRCAVNCNGKDCGRLPSSSPSESPTMNS